MLCKKIDWEFVGSDNAQVQTNYFSKGNTSTYDRGQFHPVANPTGQFHTYTIVWTKEKVEWERKVIISTILLRQCVFLFPDDEIGRACVGVLDVKSG